MPIMSESQAKTKWCPHARVQLWDMDENDLGIIGNRDRDDGGPSAGTLCLASECMAWRQVDRPIGTEAGGFCGAFGKPSGA